MKQLVWATDIHLNFLEKEQRNEFYQSVKAFKADAVLLTGDIAEANSVSELLHELVAAIGLPTYFILGNHDFYGARIANVKENLIQLSQQEKLLHYLSTCEPVTLSDDVVILGQDGWADGRYGDFKNSHLVLNDSRLIHDFAEASGLGKMKLLEAMQHFADEDASQLKAKIVSVCNASAPKKIIVLTHVPPFKEACLFQGKQTDENYLPFFATKVIGDVLIEAANKYKDTEFLILCGHTHHQAKYQALDNLSIKVGHAAYYKPQVNGQIYV